MEDAAQQPVRHDRLELVAQTGADLVALDLDGSGGAGDGVEQGSFEADLRGLRQTGRPDEDVDLAEHRVLQLGLQPARQMLLEASLDDEEVLLGDEPRVA